MGYAESQILPRSKPLQHICLMHRRLPPLEHLYQGMLVSTFWGKHSAVVPASLHAQPTDKWETLQKSHHFLFLSLLPTAKNKIKREKKKPSYALEAAPEPFAHRYLFTTSSNQHSIITLPSQAALAGSSAF